MQKIQILFPDPLMNRIRKVSEREDLPISEVVRRATTMWLDRFPSAESTEIEVPVIDAGRCLVDAEGMNKMIHE